MFKKKAAGVAQNGQLMRWGGVLTFESMASLKKQSDDHKMLNALSRFFSGNDKKGDGSRILPLKDIEDDEIPRYPPFAKGLPVANIEKVMATQAELIERVRCTLGFNIPDFNRLVLPVIRNYGAFVHLLPASESHHHRGAGGLFRHGLEVSFWAAQASESVIFSIEGTPRERRENEPRWRLASCFAGLLHDVGKPLADVSITDKGGSITWNPYSESLYDWCVRHRIDRYFIRWRDKRHKRHEQFSLLTVDRVIPAITREYLSQSGPVIIEAMLEAISGTSVNQPVTKLMLKADQESVSRDLRQSRLDVDEFSYGVPVERYVFDAIRRLVKTGKWKVNEPGAKIWNLKQGVFIASWKNLGDLYDLITHDKIPGIPRDPDTLADILIERGFAIPNSVPEKGDKAYYRYWEVIPELLKEANGGNEVKMLMLRIESNDLIFTSEPPPAVDAVVVGEAQEAEITFQDPFDLDETVANAEEEISSLDNDDDPFAISISSSASEEVTEVSGDVKAAEKEAQDALASIDFGDAFALLQMSAPVTEENVVQQNVTHENSAIEIAEETPTEKHAIPKDEPKKQPSQRRNKSAKKQADTTKVNPLKALGGDTFQFDVYGGASTPDSGAVQEKDTTFAPPEQTQSQQTSPKEAEQHTEKYDTELLSLLFTFGGASEILNDAIQPLLRREKALGEVIDIVDGQAMVLYPQGASALGDPSEVAATLLQENAITPDPITPGKKVRTVDGKKGLVLADNISKKLIARLKEMGIEVSKTADKKPPVKTREAKKTNQNNTAKTNKTQTPDVQNASKIRKPEFVAPTEKQIVERIKPGKVEIVEPGDDKLPEFKPPKGRKNKQEEINSEDLLPKVITAKKAIEQLIEMMTKGTGRWLVTPVTEESGFIVTSDKALGKIADEYQSLNKHLLRGAFKEPAINEHLKIGQGKLYLKVNKS